MLTKSREELQVF